MIDTTSSDFILGKTTPGMNAYQGKSAPVVKPGPGPDPLKGSMKDNPPPPPTLPYAPPNPLALADIMSSLESKVKSNNALMSQRNLLLKHLYDQPLTDAEKSQLDPTLLSAINSGDRNQVDLRLRLISDEIAGRNGTLDQSVQYLTSAYKDTIAQAEKKREDATNTVLKFVAQYGSNAGHALEALYGPQYTAELKSLGIDIDAFGKVSPETINQQRYFGGPGGTSLSYNPIDVSNIQNPNVGVSAWGGLSYNGLLNAAQIYLTTDGKIPSLGLGQAADAKRARTSIINFAGQLADSLGLDVPTLTALYKANSSAISNMIKQQAAVDTYERTAEANLDLMIEQVGPIVDSGSPIVNKRLRDINTKVLGSTELAAFNTARQVATNEIARVIASNPNMTQALSDAARHEVSTLIPEDATIAQIYATAKVIKRDMDNRKASINETVTKLGGNIRGLTLPTTYSNSQDDAISKAIKNAVNLPSVFPNRESLIRQIQNDYGLSADEAGRRVMDIWKDNIDRTKKVSSVGGPGISLGEDVVQGFKPARKSKGIVAGYDITAYATDPTHEQKIRSLYSKLDTVTDARSIDKYIQGREPSSPIRGRDIIAAAEEYDVDPKMILALIQQDSSFGTAGKGARTKNPGNVGNDDTGKIVYYTTWLDGLRAVARFLAENKVEDEYQFQRETVKRTA